MSALDKLKRNSKIKKAAVIEDSAVYGNGTFVTTDVPMVNLGLSANIEGGLHSGHTMLAGPSKHFKSMFGLMLAAAYLKEHKDATLLFYDNEFGTPKQYFEFFDIDMSRVLHIPITDIEELIHDISNQLDVLEEKDKVVILIDSIGNLASKKEIDDAKSGSDKADMTRAKRLKSLWRIVTPHLKIKDIPLISINHTYQTQEMFSKAVVSGGTGGIYSADNIWIIGRRQNKKATTLRGYDFIIRLEKSRFAREGSKIPITVLFEGGIQKWSGLFDVGKETGYINMPSRGWYEGVNPNTGEVVTEKFREDDINNSEDFWKTMFKETDFKSFLNKLYSYDEGKADELFEDINPDA